MSDRFHILDTPLQGMKLIERKPVRDSRGYMERLFCADDLQALMSGKHVVQINRTLTAKRGTVRGMHFQYPPHGETKLVTCLRGEVFDVAVDVRYGSTSFLHWHAEVLSADNHKTLFIPDGFAHGFQTLDEDCELLYFHTAPYRPDAEGALNAQDPMLAIRWPEAISDLSPRDTGHPGLTSAFRGLTL